MVRPVVPVAPSGAPVAAAAPAQRPATGGIPPRWRVPLLVLGFVSLVIGTTAGLARLGWSMPALSVASAGLHGPLMICGFFGVVISLERAVAVGRAWTYLGPALCGVGGIAALAGATGAASVLFVAGSSVLLAASLDIWRRQRALFTFTMAVGAACWVVGNALWLTGWGVYELVPWWLAFLILTIAGERLELSRFLPPSPVAARVFALLLLLACAALIGLRTAWGAPLFGAVLLALALWLFKQDIARRTVRQKGLTRYIAMCLLCGYAWLALGGAVMLGAGGLHVGSLSYDVALHALGLGFVFSMVFGHAPIILPAVLRVALPYHPMFYLPLALLHSSLLLRVTGDAAGWTEGQRLGGLMNALSLLLFIAVALTAVLRGSAARKRKTTGPKPQ